MALVAKSTQSTYEPIEPGSYPARVVVVADLGLQAQRPYKGEEKKPVYEVLLTYELVDEFLKDEDGNDMEDKPRWVSETFPFYPLSSEKAKSTKRYNVLDPKHKDQGDFSLQVNKPCSVTVVQNTSKDGKVWNNVAGISPLRAKEADALPKLVNSPVVFVLDDPETYENYFFLPAWIQDKVKAGLEFPKSDFNEYLDSHDSSDTETATETRTELDDEIPF